MFFKCLILIIMNINAFAIYTYGFDYEIESNITVNEKIISYEDESINLNCPLFSSRKLIWFYKPHISSVNWKLRNNKKSFYLIINSSRKLTILQPKSRTDSGIYKCEGVNNLNHTINYFIMLKIKSKSDEEIKKIGSTGVVKIIFEENSIYTINCTVEAYINNNFIFIWEQSKNNENKSIIVGYNLTVEKTNNSLIEGFKGFASLYWKDFNDWYRIYNFTLKLRNLKEYHEGVYICRIIELSQNKTIVYSFYFELLRYNFANLVLVKVIFIIMILIMLYTFKYDIEIVFKHWIRLFLQKGKGSGKYKFHFIYDFDHDTEFKRIFKIVNAVESRGFSSYFYHRDQIYGKDIIEDISSELNKSEIAVIWMSPEIWNNFTTSLCLQILLNKYKSIIRIYVMTKNKKIILKDCQNKAILLDTKSCTSSKIFTFFSEKFSLSSDIDYSEIWTIHCLVSWLISSIPLQFKI